MTSINLEHIDCSQEYYKSKFEDEGEEKMKEDMREKIELTENLRDYIHNIATDTKHYISTAYVDNEFSRTNFTVTVSGKAYKLSDFEVVALATVLKGTAILDEPDFINEIVSHTDEEIEDMKEDIECVLDLFGMLRRK